MTPDERADAIAALLIKARDRRLARRRKEAEEAVAEGRACWLKDAQDAR